MINNLARKACTTTYSRPVGVQLEHIVKSFPAFGLMCPESRHTSRGT